MMKKFFIFATVLAMFGCSNNDEVLDADQHVGKLVDAEIKVTMSETYNTRSYLGHVTKDPANDYYSIPHLFETGDLMYVTDYIGQHLFTLEANATDAYIKGKWAAIDNNAVKNGIMATFPSIAVKKDNGVTVDGSNKPTMHFTLCTEQETRALGAGEDSELSYDKKAGLAFACADNKTDGLKFLPVVSYLYFYSSKPTCTITSSEFIAGEYNVTYSGVHGTNYNASETDYSSPEGLSKFLTYDAHSKVIKCTGVHVDGHRNRFDKDATQYEYIVAIKPGTYSAESIVIEATGATKKLRCPSMTLIPSELYFIGAIDEDAAAPATTPNP